MHPVILFNNVSKKFVLRHNRADSIKSLFIRFLFKGIRESKEDLWALRNISLSVAKGECVGVIGQNGAGKSTLLYLIAGTMRPNNGDVCIRGRVAPMIELGLGFHPELSGRENVYLNASLYGLNRKKIDSTFPAILEFSELEDFIDSPILSYSSGMQARLAFSVAINLDTEILLIDEVLAVGDAHFKNKCHKKMTEFRDQGRTILFVSHDTGAVEKICNRAFLIHNGRLLADGTPGNVIKEYELL